jgi:hypothetical protein
VIAVAVLVGFCLDFAGFDAVKMLFWSAVLNGLLAPPLVILGAASLTFAAQGHISK